jgi:hypothetical protein
MSVRIRTRHASGQLDEQLYLSDTSAWRALNTDLDAHRRAGKAITADESRSVFTVRDRSGTLLQESVVTRSRASD